jgi:hypothetical protein
VNSANGILGARAIDKLSAPEVQEPYRPKLIASARYEEALPTMNQPLNQKTVSELREFAHHIGYEWAMLLGASETDWHKTVDALDKRAPLRAVHKYATTELVWLHARNLYDFLFKRGKKNCLYVGDFLEAKAAEDWKSEKRWRPAALCPEVTSNMVRAHEKLFHPNKKRRGDDRGLPAPQTVCDELRSAFSKAYGLMVGDKRDVFLAGLDHEWDVTRIVLATK